MKRSTIVRTVAIGVACALVGAAAGIAGSSASSPRPKGLSLMPLKARAMLGVAPVPGIARPLAFGPLAGAPLAGASGPPVHSDTVVPNEKGGFDTVTMDRGSFASLAGSDLTITEGTKTATYKTVTLTIPSDATVQRNGEKAQLSDLKSGDTVMVLQGPKGTTVAANDAQHEGMLQFKIRAGRPGDAPPPPRLPLAPNEGASEKNSSGTASAPETNSAS